MHGWNHNSLLRSYCFSWFVTLFVGCGTNSEGTPSTDPTPQRIQIAGAGLIGIFDPSLAEDPATGRLWMSYSTVDPSSYFPTVAQFGVSIRLAYSDDGGRNWADAGVSVAQFADAAVGPLPTTAPAPSIGAASAGTWMNETSTLVYDAAAPINERWKIVWHQYLKANTVSYFVDYSWMALKMAATPLDLASATQTKLFAGYGLRADGESTASPAFSPIGGPPAVRLVSDLNPVTSPQDVTELDTCAFGEPGLLATSDALYLSIACAHLGPTVETYIVLFSCAAPCSITAASSWRYLGRIATPADAQTIGHDKFGAPNLVAKGGQYYLTLTPITESNGDDLYDGCRVYRFSDLATGALQRSGGTLVELQRVSGIAGTHHGACTDHTALQDGILYSQFVSTDPPELFRIFQSFKTAP